VRAAVVLDGLSVVERLLPLFGQNLLREALNGKVGQWLRAQVVGRLASDDVRAVSRLEDDGRVTGLFDGLLEPRWQRCMK
jgi:hypothetical protein